jgi:hypothetical protein
VCTGGILAAVGIIIQHSIKPGRLSKGAHLFFCSFLDFQPALLVKKTSMVSLEFIIKGAKKNPPGKPGDFVQLENIEMVL